MSISKTPRIAIVGSGPAGCYAVDYLLKSFQDNVKVHVFEKLPTPFGLVRFGVAPDHPEVKQVENRFDELLSMPQVEYFGNVTVGEGGVPLQDMKERYDAVVLAYGCQEDRKLGLKGEKELSGVVSAREFVGWYNGHPEYQSNSFFDERNAFDCSDAVVIGHGNVGLDVGRMLALGKDILSKTDVTENALERLSQSRVERVHLVGRRGMKEASFTNKELRELSKLSGVEFRVHRPEDVLLESVDRKLDRAKARTHKLLKGIVEGQSEDGIGQQVVLRFKESPRELIGSSETSRVIGLDVERNRVEDGVAVGTGAIERIDCGLVFSSIGYLGHSIDGTIPFDDNRGIVFNEMGRVIVPEGMQNNDEWDPSQLYVCGWLKTGPMGIIGTNIMSSHSSMQILVDDVECGRLEIGGKDFSNDRAWIESQTGSPVVSYHEWKQLDSHEKENGMKRGAPREKLRFVEDMMKVIG